MSLDAKYALQIITNAMQRSVSNMFGGVFGLDTKHANYYESYGYPSELTFDQFYTRFKRDALASAVCSRHIEKCWQEYPVLSEDAKPDSETDLEKQIRQRFQELRLWSNLSDADLYSRVGEYSGIILRLADSKSMDQPVDVVSGGIAGLVEVIPAWQGQLTVSAWDTDVSSAQYGKPKMYNFNESAVDPVAGKNRSFEIHPDRVVIWSKSGLPFGDSALESVYNGLVDAEKIRGAGGEGFFQAAKGTPHYKIDRDANIQQLAQMLGASDPSEINEKMGEISDGIRKGFDKALTTQGIDAEFMSYNVPNAQESFNIALQTISAGSSIPLKILIGSQSGERASTEDANEWAKTCQSRRNNFVIPNIMQLVNRLERFRILPERDWTLVWPDLTESTKSDKVSLSDKLANINKNSIATGIPAPFSAEELRMAAGYKAEID